MMAETTTDKVLSPDDWIMHICMDHIHIYAHAQLLVVHHDAKICLSHYFEKRDDSLPYIFKHLFTCVMVSITSPMWVYQVYCVLWWYSRSMHGKGAPWLISLFPVRPCERKKGPMTPYYCTETHFSSNTMAIYYNDVHAHCFHILY